MTGKLTIWTYDWVPEGPRGFVRDLRLRWAAEEAELAEVYGSKRHLPQQLLREKQPRRALQIRQDPTTSRGRDHQTFWRHGSINTGGS